MGSEIYVQDEGGHRSNEQETRLSFPGIHALLAGGVGGVCSVSVGHPFDLIKVRLQTADKAMRVSALDSVRKSVARDGLRRGLYAGVSAPLLAVTPIYAVSFWGYDLGRLIVRECSGSSPRTELSIGQVYLAGFISAVPMNMVSTPFERVKVLLQTQGPNLGTHGGTGKPHPNKDSQSSGILRRLYREGGVRSMYKGAALTFARDGPDSAAYFATYEYCKKRFSPTCPEGEEATLSLFAVSAAGAVAGIIMLIPLFPIDTMKSRMQSSEGKAHASTIAKTLYRSGGVRAFYPGLAPALLRALPANAAATLGWELAREALERTSGSP